MIADKIFFVRVARFYKLLTYLLLFTFSVGGVYGADDSVTLYGHSESAHTVRINDFIRETDISDRVEYIEVNDNVPNLDELRQLWSDLEVPRETRGWPFLVYEGDEGLEYIIGDQPIISFLAQRYQLDVNIVEDTETTYTKSVEEDDEMRYVVYGLYLLLFILTSSFAVIIFKNRVNK